MPSFERRSEIDVPAAELYRWHARPGAFLRLAPPWQRIEVVEAAGGTEDGARLILRVGRAPFAVRWVAVHREHEPGRRFVDVQEAGPFARWIHDHRFEELDSGGSALVDRVDWALPFGTVGAAVGNGFVLRALDRLFAYRHAITRSDLSRHAPHRAAPALRVAVTGASGLVGSALCAFLTTGGHEVRRLVRGPARRAGEISWEPASGRIEREKLEGLDAVVHLAGENIAGGRWTASRKATILRSRTKGTRLIAETIASLASKPKAFLSASAVGTYGSHGDEPVDERVPAGAGFLAEVGRAWEEAAAPAEGAGVRTVLLRFGIILSPRGGALAKMLLPFRLGAGGPIGGGGQGFSWIALDDVVYAIHHLIRHEVSGPVNVVGPAPIPQREFARALGRTLARPAIVPLPGIAVRALFGELGTATLLSGAFVQPARLRASGFGWTYPGLDDALAMMLGRASRTGVSSS